MASFEDKSLFDLCKCKKQWINGGLWLLGVLGCVGAIVVCVIVLILGYASGAKDDASPVWTGIGLGVAGLIVLFLLKKLDCVIESTPN